VAKRAWWKLPLYLVGAFAGLYIAGSVAREIIYRRIPRRPYALVLSSTDGDAEADARILERRFQNLQAIARPTRIAPGHIEMTVDLPVQYRPAQLLSIAQRAHVALQLVPEGARDRPAGPEILTNRDIKAASLQFDQGRPTVSLELTKEATPVFADFTAKNVGKFLAVVLDGKVETAAQITGPIPGGLISIHLDSTPSPQEALDKAKDLSLVLRAGELSGTWNIVQFDTTH
jgi:preprotein translocase subunit SecD